MKRPQFSLRDSLFATGCCAMAMGCFRAAYFTKDELPVSSLAALAGIVLVGAAIGALFKAPVLGGAVAAIVVFTIVAVLLTIAAMIVLLRNDPLKSWGQSLRRNDDWVQLAAVA